MQVFTCSYEVQYNGKGLWPKLFFLYPTHALFFKLNIMIILIWRKRNYFLQNFGTETLQEFH